MKKISRIWVSILIIFLSVLTGFAQQPASSASSASRAKPVYSIFLIGDSGEPSIANSAQLQLLQKMIEEAGSESTIIYLGDNIYPRGMPDEENKHRQEAEDIIRAQLSILNDYDGKVVIIPGNHDWEKGKNDGMVQNQRQEEFVENFMDSRNVYLPDDGCPGPVEVPLNDHIVLIIVDTQWVLHPWEKPRVDDGCLVQSSADLIEHMEDALRRNGDKRIIVVSHHPMITYGIHGGSTTFKDHLFPLTAASPNLYLPLPIIGSIYPFYRKFIGSRQDVANVRYKSMRNEFMDLFKKYPGLIHAAGHEHSLQYSLKDSIHYIVSGAGVKNTPVKHKGFAQFVEDTIGFARLDYFEDGTTNLSFIRADGATIYEKEIDDNPYSEIIDQLKLVENFSITETSVSTMASDEFLKKEKQYWLVGENYRNVWAAKIEVQVFDIGAEHGGLKIVQRGGGMQTKSLRLEDPTGKQYVLRSVRKYTEKIVPLPLRETVAGDLIQDQISSSNPYGAFPVQYLAQAADIYHTNPQLVYIPSDPRFGIYQEDFANTLALYEERPAGDRSDIESFGRSDKIYNTAKMLQQLYKDNDNYVDQSWVLKSRLFDLYIGDWDRHDDQWRWASFDKKNGKMFRPIPRDRDQAFFVSEGLIMSLVKKKWAMPKFQGFDYDLKYPAGFMFNARYFDRDFLNSLDAKDWLEGVRHIQSKMTDEVIESAIGTWPSSVYDLVGEEVISKLKVRREKLNDFAMDYYYFLSRKVNVRGSNKKEYFKVERLNNDETRVRVYKMTDKAREDKLLFDRTFLNKETKELRLYGLKGADVFDISGKANKGIKIRVIGGGGKDSISDISKVAGLSKKTIVYDTKKGTKLNLGSESRNKTSKKPGVNVYNRKDFKYDVVVPLAFLNFNADDGLIIGAGFFYTKHGFRKEPFKSQHFVLGSVALGTFSWDFRYKGTFTDVLGDFDFKINALAQSPNFTSNFFGLGNESVFDQDADETNNVDEAIDYYRVRYEHYSVELLLEKNLGTKGYFSFGPHWQGFETRDDYDGEDRFILDYAAAIGDQSIFEFKTYSGLVFKLGFDSRDNKILTNQGVLYNFDIRGYTGVNNASNSFSKTHSDLTFYYTFHLPTRLTLAARVGGGDNRGGYEYYQGQILSGPTQIRGYRKTRFNGDQVFYGNFELRYHLAMLKNRVIPTRIGFNAFYDIGRVWLSGEDSKTWHSGVGGGLWLAPLDAVVFTFEFAGSKEGTRFYIRTGFMF